MEDDRRANMVAGKSPLPFTLYPLQEEEEEEEVQIDGHDISTSPFFLFRHEGINATESKRTTETTSRLSLSF